MVDMPRLSIFQARELWQKAVAEKGWQSSTLEKVMFDWESGKPTRYHSTPPAFYSLAMESETVDEAEFRALVDELIRRGERFSNLGRARSVGVLPRSRSIIAPSSSHMDQ